MIIIIIIIGQCDQLLSRSLRRLARCYFLWWPTRHWTNFGSDNSIFYEYFIALFSLRYLCMSLTSIPFHFSLTSCRYISPFFRKQTKYENRKSKCKLVRSFILFNSRTLYRFNAKRSRSLLLLMSCIEMIIWSDNISFRLEWLISNVVIN